MKITETETISSKDNKRLKFARSVRDGHEPDFMFIEGVRLVREAIRSKIIIELAFVSEGSDLEDLAGGLATEVFTVTAKVFDSIVDTKNSQGIIAIARKPTHSLKGLDAEAESVTFVYLKEVNNPANLGAVVRTAEAAGVKAILTSNGSADAFSPKAIRSSMGSAFRLPIVEGIDFGDVVEWAKGNGIETLAADINSKTDHTELNWQGKKMVVFGSEAFGLKKDEIDAVDKTIFIPMENGVESLNLAVSAGIILFEAKRQRDKN